MEPTRITVKKLFALSGNRCAFPDCPLPIVEASGTVTGIVCHIRARKRGGPRFDRKQSEEQRHAFDNLILLCARHSKVIDTEPAFYTVEKLTKIKAAHARPAENELSSADGRRVDALLADYRDLYVHAREVVIERLDKAVFTGVKRPTITAPEGSIGSDLLRRNYTKHLIDRYNHFASRQPNRSAFVFPAVFSLIESRYGVKKWELVSLQHFDELCELLRERIDKTWLGCVKSSKGQKNYSSLEEYRVKYHERSARRGNTRRQ